MLEFKQLDKLEIREWFYGNGLESSFSLIDRVLMSKKYSDCIIARLDSEWFYVEDDSLNEVAGIFCLLTDGRSELEVPNSVHLCEFEINSKYRNRGIGTSILQKIILINRSKNITLYSEKDLQGFYSLCGFEVVGDSDLMIRKHNAF